MGCDDGSAARTWEVGSTDVAEMFHRDCRVRLYLSDDNIETAELHSPTDGTTFHRTLYGVLLSTVEIGTE